MDLDDMMKPKKPIGPFIGESLATLSVDDLEARLAALSAERARVEAEIEARLASRQAAEGFFKS
jgi:uncharacterized small protein (DUF1192 family)